MFPNILRKAFEQVRQLFIHVPLFEQCLDTEIVFVGDQSAKFLLGSFVNTGLCKQLWKNSTCPMLT